MFHVNPLYYLGNPINTKALIAAIVAKCEVSEERAANELKIAKVTAKSLGLSLVETLKILGFV